MFRSVYYTTLTRCISSSSLLFVSIMTSFKKKKKKQVSCLGWFSILFDRQADSKKKNHTRVRRKRWSLTFSSHDARRFELPLISIQQLHRLKIFSLFSLHVQTGQIQGQSTFKWQTFLTFLVQNITLHLNKLFLDHKLIRLTWTNYLNPLFASRVQGNY